MTKFVNWARMRLMNSKEKSGINTATTFSEQREEKQNSKTIGIGKKNENKAK
jgi:hypothetical protein